jgi:mannose-6-phosphate isomerase
VDLLENAIQPYAWGSRTAIAGLLGRPVPSPGPQAELWMGAHPLAPSHLLRAGERLSLTEAIARAPEAELGPRSLKEHGPVLPFLLKVLASETPLSLQAHPDLALAKEGFAREQRAGIPLDAPHRNYKDPHPKPELLCALTPFDALCGFRPPAEALAVLDALGEPALSAVRDRLAIGGPEGLRQAFTYLVTLPKEEGARLAAATVAAAARAGESPFGEAFAWTGRLDALYPGDAGVVVALLLRLVHLSPGEALFLDAGNMHAYLHGVGVEVMAASDNVLRGGLTPKHLDAPELLRVLRFGGAPVPVVHPMAGAPGEQVYLTPSPQFELSRIALAGQTLEVEVAGPEILLCVEGQVAASSYKTSLPLGRGASVFVPASTAHYSLRGEGVVFRSALPRRL